MAAGPAERRPIALTASDYGRPSKLSRCGRLRRLQRSSAGALPDNPARPVSSRPTHWAGSCKIIAASRWYNTAAAYQGQVTYTGLLPSRGIAVSVFSNVEDRVSAAIRNAILDRLIDAPPFDWPGGLWPASREIAGGGNGVALPAWHRPRADRRPVAANRRAMPGATAIRGMAMSSSSRASRRPVHRLRTHASV